MKTSDTEAEFSNRSLLTPTFRRAARENLSSIVEQELREAILRGRFKPGDRLRPAQLAPELGTSVTPVREAIMKLVAERVLEARPGQFIVPVLSKEQYSELCTIRIAVEGLAAEQASMVITKNEFNALKSAAAMHQNAVGRHDYEQGLRYNQLFRFGIYRAARMPALLAIIEGLWLQTAPFFNYLYPSDHVSSQTCKAYRKVLEGFEKKDGAAVREALCQSIRIGTQYLIEGIESNVFKDDRAGDSGK
jgi:GntR family colanic acid and biofilm gene transcriptional regulator